ncbi:MAG: TldD/PmbA family protein, partial [Chloroflexi bacterium]|nr:TldD/PmbA family protein [Chloroflexota bacterium]
MFSESELRHILETALASSRADQMEVSLWVTDSALTRYANSYIHQNVAEKNAHLTVRAVLGKKVGVASAASIESESIRQVVARAQELAELQPENPDFRSLPGPAPVAGVDAFLQRTAEFGPDHRAQAVGIICRKAKEAGFVASGTFTIATSQLAIANSLGVFVHHSEALAEVTTVIMSDTSSGYAQTIALDVDEIDPEAVAEEAIIKTRRGQNPVAIDPGEYEVILEENAVSDILDFLAYLGFSALAVQEERSFMGGKFGQRVLEENITLWDDGLGAGSIPMPFDFEGVPKKRVDFIVNGVANAVCYDSYTAGKEGKASTGHALPAGETFGPMPMNMFLKAGTATREEMIAGIQRGLWVSRFWYTRPVHPLT